MNKALSESSSTLILFLIIVVLFILLATLICLGMDFHYYRKQKKFNKKFSEYVTFKNRFDELQREQSEIWNDTMPDYRRAVEYCLKEMKFITPGSEIYKDFEQKLEIARDKITVCRELYDLKGKEIKQFVRDNKSAIETIREHDPDLYESWVTRYELDKTSD